MTGDWQPMGERLGWRTAGTMADGVPDWISSAFDKWVNTFLLELPDGNREQLVEQLGLELRLPLQLDYRPAARVLRAVKSDLERPQERMLEVADWLLHLHATVGADAWAEVSTWMPTAPEKLEYVLRTGGSRWRVSSDGHQLEDRVDPTVVAAADQAIDAAAGAGTTAAKHLRVAWDAMYGLNPDYGKAITEAILAVEAAGKPAVTGKPHGTLSAVLHGLERPGCWSLPMALEWVRGSTVASTDAGEVLAGMVKVVWQGQGERHGSPTSAVPKTPEQAEAILTVAVALVHLFSTGLVRQVAAPKVT